MTRRQAASLAMVLTVVPSTACSTSGEPVTREEACRNVSRLCRDLLTEAACLAGAADAGIDDTSLLCLANAGSCDEIIVCEGGLPGSGPDAGTANADASFDAGSDAGADAAAPF